MPPRDEAEVFRNPLGIYIVSISWSKEFTDPVSTIMEPAQAPTRRNNEETSRESND